MSQKQIEIATKACPPARPEPLLPFRSVSGWLGHDAAAPRRDASELCRSFRPPE